MPKFSIITVCKNIEQSIERTIQSVIEQNFKNYEYLIIDGKSTDNTLQIIKRYGKYVTKLVSEADTGIYAAV
jgi:glycosyltransferase involved in cell wall biosynthesis